MERRDDRPGGEDADGRATPSVRRISSRTLFGDQRMLVIRHGGADYRLQVTRSGKLILTK